MHSTNETSQWVSKVPQVTLIFWVIKILATTLGETAGDALSMSLGLGYLLSTGIFALIFLVLVALQIRAKQFHPATYWLTIIATTTLGTTIADFADRSLGIGYAGGVTLLSGLLILSLLIWHKTLGTISVNHIQSSRAEVFYWVTIMFSQTLGTAMGDWVADTNGLGYGASALIFGVILLALGVCYFKGWFSRVALFWAAFVFTRPLGAVVGDFLDKPISDGGLAFSRYTATAVLIGLILLCLLAFKQQPAERPH